MMFLLLGARWGELLNIWGITEAWVSSIIIMAPNATFLPGNDGRY